MENIIIILVVALIIGLAGGYVYKAKKSGQKCIGCPHASTCNTTKNENSCNGSCEHH